MTNYSYRTGKNIVPGKSGESSVSSNLDVSKLVPSDETMGLKSKQVLDFVAESAKLTNNNQNSDVVKDDVMKGNIHFYFY